MFNSLRKRPGARVWLLAVAALLSVCPVAAQDAPVAPSKEVAVPATYKLQPGDEVSIEVNPQRTYSCAGLILPDGDLFLRNIGKVKASGMTLEQLKAQVQKTLEADLNNPRVLVTLTKMAPPPPMPLKPSGMNGPDGEKPVKLGKVTIVGAVSKPGAIDLEPGMRLRKALDLAGGTLRDADMASIVIIHGDLTRTTVDLSLEDSVLNPAHNRMLKDGDSVEVRSIPTVIQTVPTVRIRGLVANPGQYDLKAGMGLEDLIVAAGKLSPMADVENVQFQRQGAAVRNIDLIAQQKLGLQGKILLQPGDEIFIGEAENAVFLVGAMPNPGRRSFKPGQKLRDFLLGAGDAAVFNPAMLDLQNAEVVRRGEPKPTKVDLKALLRKGDRADNLELQNGDILFVQAKRGPKRSPLDALGSLGPVGFLFGLF